MLAAARDADKARAAGSTAPLLGVPLGVKDSYATRGLRTTLGMGILGSFVPTEDAEIVSAIRDAGGIVFGKNNLVEMSYGLTGNNVDYGQVKNPLWLRTCSGGFIERVRSLCGGSDRAGVVGRRHRRLDPSARIALRCRGLQADYRTVVTRWRRADLPYA